MIVFFHGNEATLSRDVRERQQVPRQVTQSGSTPCWWRRNSRSTRSTRARAASGAGAFAQFITEAGERLTVVTATSARGGVPRAPVVIAAYSGGYSPAAFVLHAGRVDDRLRGVVLFDALYGSSTSSRTGSRRPPAFFVSSFGKAAREENTTLQRMLRERGVRFQNALPANLTRGSVTFLDATDDVKHVDFMTEAWVDDPLKVVLREFPASRAGGAPAGATAKPK